MTNRSHDGRNIGRRGNVGRFVCLALAVTLFGSCRGVATYRPVTETSPVASPIDAAPSRVSPNLLDASAASIGVRPAPRHMAQVIHERPGQSNNDRPATHPAATSSRGVALAQAIGQPPMTSPVADCPCHPHDPDVMTGFRPWQPPGIASPWPQDEYLCDGGDQTPAVRVRSDWSVIGLDLEDTVVHYDTLDGETHVEPSNRVCVYSPRFAAVRRVHGIAQNERHERIAGVEQPIPVEGMGDVQIATTAVQPVQPSLNRATKSASGFRERMPSVQLENRQSVTGMQGALLPYEDFSIIRLGLMDNSEKAQLAQSTQAAAVWSADQAVQVVIDNIATHEDAGVSGAESVYVYELKGKPRLRVCKVASRQDARPGEVIDFTIRFDNVGDQTIGNVTVIDNLTTRLEYVDGSQQCSLGANFSSAVNQGESLVLRWEIVGPLEVAQGGTIRFQCRVR